MEERMTRTEEQLAYLARAVEDLSEIAAAQQEEIAQLKRRVAMLSEREAERDVQDHGGVALADARPPHW